MTLKYGGLCEGYGGLTMGVQSVLGGELAWYSEFDPAPSRILAHHHPDVPNLGDMTRIDWRKVQPVDVLTGGTPCTDLSHAGKRAGMHEGTRSNLWVQMREAIHVIRPKLVVWENVRGAYSACADSEVGRCPRCVGDDPRARHQPSLRALGRVLGDLSSLGYDAGWYGIRAADVGACHGRFRVFVWATPADTDHAGWGEHGWAEPVRAEQSAAEHVRADAADLTLLPTPRTSDTNGAGAHARKLLPTPTAMDYKASGGGSPSDVTLTDATVRQSQDWAQYEAAIRRHEHVLGRAAPPPTEPGPKGGARLRPTFVEFMMMLPEGHVTNPAIWEGMTDKRGKVLTGDGLKSAARNAELKALGNGVVPPQCAATGRMWLADMAAERGAA
jgi:DNA (cytosine-5)-methyltransferase 1